MIEPRRLAATLLFLCLALRPSLAAPGTASLPSSNVFEDAKVPHAWSFPLDDGAHFSFKDERWVYSGFLGTAEGGSYHFQLEFIREGLKRVKETTSAFEPMDLSIASFTVTDLNAREGASAWKRNRTGPSLSAFQEGRLKIRNEDWSAVYEAPGHRLKASCGPYRLDLQVSSGVVPTFHGDKGSMPWGGGLFSRYASRMRMWAGGVLTVDGKPCSVTGSAWMDHEFYSLGEGLALPSSDWMGFYLSDGSQLMLRRLRNSDGGESVFSRGTWVDPVGNETALRSGDFILEPLGGWKSKATGASYPLAWRITVPGVALTLETEAPVEDRERVEGYPGATPSWEGPVTLKGQRKGRPLTGKGFLRLTGYAKEGAIQ